MTLLHAAAFVNKPKALEKLIKLGLNLNKQDEEGKTALIIAATRKSKQAIKMLIEHGADQEIKD